MPVTLLRILVRWPLTSTFSYRCPASRNVTLPSPRAGLAIARLETRGGDGGGVPPRRSWPLAGGTSSSSAPCALGGALRRLARGARTSAALRAPTAPLGRRHGAAGRNTVLKTSHNNNALAGPSALQTRGAFSRAKRRSSALTQLRAQDPLVEQVWSMRRFIVRSPRRPGAPRARLDRDHAEMSLHSVARFSEASARSYRWSNASARSAPICWLAGHLGAPGRGWPSRVEELDGRPTRRPTRRPAPRRRAAPSSAASEAPDALR